MKALRLFIALSVVLGIIYPLLVTIVAQVFFNDQANGSLLKAGNEIIGSRLIAQKFSLPRYFWPRPSAVNYQTLPSGGSNLGPISPKLQEEVTTRKAFYGHHAPAELLYTSGSGLDPHLSKESILFQLDRVAQARGMNKEIILQKMDSMSLINVLELNLWMDSIHE